MQQFSMLRPWGIGADYHLNGQRNLRLDLQSSARRQLDALQLEHLGRAVAVRLHEVDGEVDEQVLQRSRLASQREVHGDPTTDRDALRLKHDVLNEELQVLHDRLPRNLRAVGERGC